MAESLKVGDEISLDKAAVERLHRLHDSDIQKICFDKEGLDVVIEIELCQCYARSQPHPLHLLTEIRFKNCDKIECCIEPQEEMWLVSIVKFSQLDDGSWEFETHVAGMNNGSIKIASNEAPKLKVIKELEWGP